MTAHRGGLPRTQEAIAKERMSSGDLWHTYYHNCNKVLNPVCIGALLVLIS